MSRHDINYQLKTAFILTHTEKIECLWIRRSFSCGPIIRKTETNNTWIYKLCFFISATNNFFLLFPENHLERPVCTKQPIGLCVHHSQQTRNKEECASDKSIKMIQTSATALGRQRKTSECNKANSLKLTRNYKIARQWPLLFRGQLFCSRSGFHLLWSVVKTTGARDARWSQTCSWGASL